MANWLERLGALLATGGIIWAVHVATLGMDFNDMLLLPDTFQKIMMQTGPLEVCAAGVILWLLAKWRRMVVLR